MYNSNKVSLFCLVAFASAFAASGCSGGGGEQTPPPTTHAISGLVTGTVIEGVTVTLSGAAPGSTTTDAAGTMPSPASPMAPTR